MKKILLVAILIFTMNSMGYASAPIPKALFDQFHIITGFEKTASTWNGDSLRFLKGQINFGEKDYFIDYYKTCIKDGNKILAWIDSMQPKIENEDLRKMAQICSAIIINENEATNIKMKFYSNDINFLEASEQLMPYMERYIQLLNNFVLEEEKLLHDLKSRIGQE